MRKKCQEPVFLLPATIYRMMCKRKPTKGVADRIIRPFGLKNFWFTQGKLILVASVGDPSCTPIRMSVQWKEDGTDFKLGHTTVDTYV